LIRPSLAGLYSTADKLLNRLINHLNNRTRMRPSQPPNTQHLTISPENPSIVLSLKHHRIIEINAGLDGAKHLAAPDRLIG
jgi:hypothetical protein